MIRRAVYVNNLAIALPTRARLKVYIWSAYVIARKSIWRWKDSYEEMEFVETSHHES